MKEFESNSDAWNWEWKSLRQVRSFESEMEELEPSSRLGIGNGGVRAKFRRLESKLVEFEPSSRLGIDKLRSSSQIPTLGIGIGRVRAMFSARNQEWRSSSQVLGLELGMEEFEPSSMLGIGNRGVLDKFRGLELEMVEFEPSSSHGIGKWRSSSQIPTLGIGNGRVRAKFCD